MATPNLSTPYPATYRPPKVHGVPKIVQAMAQPPIGWGVGAGQSEDDNGDFMPHDPRPPIGWAQPLPPNLLQRIQQAPQVQNLGQHLNTVWNENPQKPLGQRLLSDVQEIGWEIPTTAYRAGLDAASVIGSGGRASGAQDVNQRVDANMPGPAKGFMQATDPLVQYAPDILSMGAGAVDLARGAAKLPGAVKAVGEAVANPRSVPGMIARAPLGLAMGAAGGGAGRPKGKIRVPSVDEINQYVAAHPGNISDLLTQFRDALPDMQHDQVQEALGIFRQHDPTIFKKQGVGGLVIEAASAVKADDGETATQAVAQAAQEVKKKRTASRAKAAVEQGLDPQELLQELMGEPKPATVPLPAEEEATVESLPYFPQDIQDAVVSSLGRTVTGERPKINVPYMTKASVAGHVIGTSLGSATGYETAQYTAKDQAERDDMKRNLAYAFLGGATGAMFGHTLTAGSPRGLADRLQQQVFWQWLNTGSVGLKGVATDIPSLVVAPALRLAERTVGGHPFLGMADAVKYMKSYGAGLGPGIKQAANVMVKSGQTGAGMDVTLSPYFKTPGEFVGSLIPSIIQGAAAITESMHASSLKVLDAPALDQETQRLLRTNPDRVMEWFKAKIAKEPHFRDAMLDGPAGDNVLSELWGEHNVMQQALEAYVDEGRRTFQHDVLGGTPEERARKWTLTSNVDPLLTFKNKKPEFNTEGTTGLFGRISYAPGQLLSGLNIPIGGGHTIPVGRMLAGFYRVASNAGDQAINFTPILGELNQLPFKAISPELRRAKQVVGGVSTLALMAIIGDNADGTGPSDPKANREWRDAGHIPETTNVLGHRISNKYLGPFGWAAAHAMGALNDLHAYESWAKQKYGTDPNVHMMAQQALGEFLGAITDEGYFNNLNDLFTLFTGASQATAGQPLSSQFMSQAGYQVAGFVPNLLAEPATAERATQPSTGGGILDRVKARIPGIERQVPANLNSMGHEVPNPQQGWESLLGSYAGRAQFTDATGEKWLTSIGKEDPVGLGTLNARQFHAKPDGKGGVIPGSGLPMPPPLRDAVRKITGATLEANTDGWLKQVANMPDAEKVTTLRKFQTQAHDDAFFQAVNAYGRDKYLAGLTPQQQSTFKSDELDHQRNKDWQKAQYTDRQGKPVGDPSTWAENNALIKKWQDSKKPKTQWPMHVQTLEREQQYAKAAMYDRMAKSPDLMDYAFAKWLKPQGVTEEQWQGVLGGHAAIFGDPGQYDVPKQVEMLRQTKLYSALPANDPRKNALKARVTNWARVNHIKAMGDANPKPAQVVNEAEALAAEATAPTD